MTYWILFHIFPKFLDKLTYFHNVRGWILIPSDLPCSHRASPGVTGVAGDEFESSTAGIHFCGLRNQLPTSSVGTRWRWPGQGLDGTDVRIYVWVYMYIYIYCMFRWLICHGWYDSLGDSRYHWINHRLNHSPPQEGAEYSWFIPSGCCTWRSGTWPEDIDGWNDDVPGDFPWLPLKTSLFNVYNLGISRPTVGFFCG